MTAPSFVPALLVDALGWALLRFVWEGMAIGAAAALLLGAMRRHGARQRYAVCCVALGMCAALPTWQVAATLWTTDGGSAPAAVAALPWQIKLAQRLPLVVTAWSLGALAMIARLAAGMLWVHRLRARAVAVPAPLEAALGTLAARIGAPLGVLVRSVERLAAPVTVGWWRPVVLVPAAMLTQMPPALLEALLAHELAHIMRRDYLVNLLQAGVEALLFFHPVVWWLSARLRAERELVADEIASHATGDRRALARALQALTLAPTSVPRTGWAVPARGGSLLRRVEALMSPQPRLAGWKPALVATLLAGTSLLVQWYRSPAVAAPADRVARAETPLNAPVNTLSSIGAALAMPSGVYARHALVLDEATGQVLMARDADAVVPIASLTKLMTAMVVLDAGLAPEQNLHIEPADVDQRLHSGSQLAVGARMTRDAALVLALMASDNRAAAALARTYPGGAAAFDAALQAKIHTLGLRRTTLAEPTGLSPANASTATEMARIVAASARYPKIAAITGEAGSEVIVDGHPRRLRNHNPFVGEAGWDIRVSKTGFTRAAGNCLTMSLHASGKNVTLVLLDIADDDQRLRDALAIRQALARRTAM
jgi:D-alanyl-D-alanine endopeptidase (penicillin-binding protein 7)